jgi:hypothetical protein
MNFVKTPDKIPISPYDNIEFYDAEIMTVYFETKPKILKKLGDKIFFHLLFILENS